VAQKEEQSWNKPLMLIQSVLFPWSFYVLLKQYDSELDDFGPLNRAVIPAILSVVFFACKYFFHIFVIIFLAFQEFIKILLKLLSRFSDNDEIAAQQAAKMVHFQHNSGLPWLHRLDLRNRYRKRCRIFNRAQYLFSLPEIAQIRQHCCKSLSAFSLVSGTFGTSTMS